MISDKFVILGALINVAGTSTYILHTLQGNTRPNRVTWFMWALAPMVAFAAELGKGVGIVALMTFMNGFCPLLILLASFVNKKSVWKLTGFDFACGGLSVLGLILWRITSEGNVAIILSIAADALAAAPTLRKSFTNPETESWVAFSTAAIGSVIALLTIDKWTLANWGFQLYVLVVCVGLVLLIKFKLGLKLQHKLS